MTQKLSALVNISQLVTCEESQGLGIIKEAAIIFNDDTGKIVDLGPEKNLQKKYNFPEIICHDVKNRPVLPGFIDPHTHFIFGGYRAEEYLARLEGSSYLEIMEAGGGIEKTVKDTRNSSLQQLYNQGWQRLNKFLQQGITTLEGKSGYGMELDTELKQLEVMRKLNKNHPIDIKQTFLGAHVIPKEYKNNRERYINILIKEILPVVAKRNDVIFCDVFCDQGVYTVSEAREILLAAQKLGLKSKIHVDEIAYVGGAELAAEIGAVSAEHLLKVSTKGIKLMKDEGVIPVILPITAFSLQEEYAPARKMRSVGLDIALATDLNPGSSYSQSIPLLLALATIKLKLSIEEAIKGITINAARALDLEDEIGSLAPGKKADLVVLDAPGYEHLIYHIATNIVHSVYKEGEIVKKKDKEIFGGRGNS